MRTEKEIKDKLEALKNQTSPSSDMNSETAGAREALEWVLGKRAYLSAGRR